MYVNDFSLNKGWVCPKCGRVFAPSQPYCLFCNGNQYNYYDSIMLDQVIDDAIARIKEKSNNE